MSTDDQYKKLKEPTPDSFPHFEEESWRKMEALLDKHLPENNGRLFPLLLLFSCAILIGLTTFLPAKKQQTSVDVVTKNKASVPTVEPVPVSEEIKEQQPPVINDLNNNSNNQQLQTSEIVLGREDRSQLKHPTVILTQTERKDAREREFVNNKITDVVFEDLLLASTGRAVSFNKEINILLPTSKPVIGSSLTAHKEEAPVPKKPVKKNSLSLTFSTGLEAPGTAFNKWGKLTPLLGVGLQYSFNDKLILRTGVSTAAKIYSAQDKDYNPTNSYWSNYTYFRKIDADCKILEIPLSVAYRVVNGKKTSMYVSAGSSSYIMRKEAYNYYYKNQAGRDTVTHRAWNNNSLHLFSSVNFSAIVERKLSNRFSLMAEPIIKIPTGGIGVGKIRLYNAGLTVTAKFKLR
jgi:hypothetical protein